MNRDEKLPVVIQGGMGIGISSWKLARTVSMTGQLGVVSGTSIDSVLARRLQDGDEGGHIRRIAARFPHQGTVDAAFSRYFKDHGRDPGEAYRLVPMYQVQNSDDRQRFTAFASFVEVALAKEGHDGIVGINLLTKIQLPNLAVLLGAMLAGVDYVLMGAGIPREFPEVLENYARGLPAKIRLDLVGGTGEPQYLTLDPRSLFPELTSLRKPKFLPIISSHQLAKMFLRKGMGQVDGFVVEGPEAGGHNAPPRAKRGGATNPDSIFGEDDYADLSVMRELGLPFWLAGLYSSPARLAEARAEGAIGIQTGTLFAMSEESGLAPHLRARVLEEIRAHRGVVKTDVRASPTGFPFKVVSLDDTLSSEEVYQGRSRTCDLGYLREAYADESGKVGFRCSGESVEAYVKKGGKEEDTVGRRCLCNALMSTADYAQIRDEGYVEPPVVTSGSGLEDVFTMLDRPEFEGKEHYSAKEVVTYLLSAHPYESVQQENTTADATPGVA